MKGGATFSRETRFGPALLGGGRVRFRLWAPARTAVALEIEGREPIPMQAGVDGVFEVVASCEPGRRYRFQLGDLAVPDPASRLQDGGDVHGWSVVVDPHAYDWRSPDWAGRPWEETVLYEVHPGLYGGFSGLMSRLEGWREIGVTAIELMPIAEVSGLRNWGYDGVLPYAPAAAYGSPDELKALIDKAHGLGLMVFLDVVYNHFGPDGNYLNAYAPQVFDEAVQTPWGGAIDFGKGPVRDYFADNALYWIEEFRFDGLRFDAVHAIKDGTWLDEMGASVRTSAGGRQVHLVLENEQNGAAHLRGPFDAQWNDDFHNVLHVLLTGETGAYYADFAEQPIQKLARCLAEGFIYQGEPSPNHDGKPRGEPSGDLAPTAFVSFLQNHDQVGNRAMGERLISLTSPAELKAAVALLLLCPQVPMLFMGEEEGARTPFLFFTDFHDELADAVREGRRKEFAKFPEFSDPEKRKRIPDPNALETYERSRPQPGPNADEWRSLYGDLLKIRRERLVPHLKGSKALGAEVVGDKAVLARWRLANASVLTLGLNLGDQTVETSEDPGGEVIYGPVSRSGLAPCSLCAWLEDGA